MPEYTGHHAHLIEGHCFIPGIPPERNFFVWRVPANRCDFHCFRPCFHPLLHQYFVSFQYGLGTVREGGPAHIDGNTQGIHHILQRRLIATLVTGFLQGMQPYFQQWLIRIVRCNLQHCFLISKVTASQIRCVSNRVRDGFTRLQGNRTRRRDRIVLISKRPGYSRASDRDSFVSFIGDFHRLGLRLIALRIIGSFEEQLVRRSYQLCLERSRYGCPQQCQSRCAVVIPVVFRNVYITCFGVLHQIQGIVKSTHARNLIVNLPNIPVIIWLHHQNIVLTTESYDHEQALKFSVKGIAFVFDDSIRRLVVAEIVSRRSVIWIRAQGDRVFRHISIGLGFLPWHPAVWQAAVVQNKLPSVRIGVSVVASSLGFKQPVFLSFSAR